MDGSDFEGSDIEESILLQEVTPFPELPVEILREIFEVAARRFRNTMLTSLLLVSGQVYKWLRPVLYEFIYVSGSETSSRFIYRTVNHDGPSDEKEFLRSRTLAIVIDSKFVAGPPTVGSHLADEDAAKLLQICENASHLAMRRELALDSSALPDQVAKMALQRLYVNAGESFFTKLLKNPVDSVPMWNTLTHFHSSNLRPHHFTKDPDPFHNVTHFCVNFSWIVESPLWYEDDFPVLQRLAERSGVLAVIMMVHQGEEDQYYRALEEHGIDGLRFVAFPSPNNWRDFDSVYSYLGSNDIYSRADLIIAKRKVEKGSKVD